jgi:hypothetical protein
MARLPAVFYLSSAVPPGDSVSKLDGREQNGSGVWRMEDGQCLLEPGGGGTAAAAQFFGVLQFGTAPAGFGEPAFLFGNFLQGPLFRRLSVFYDGWKFLSPAFP